MFDLQFTPKREEELTMLLHEGVGNFEVIMASPKVSKNGNKMVELLLRCWDCNGQQSNIFDYLILNENPLSLRKIRHFCYAVSLEKEYESGKLNAVDCVGRSGNLMIGIEKDKTGTYPDKNKVYDFLKADTNKPTEKPTIGNKLDDDIPF